MNTREQRSQRAYRNAAHRWDNATPDDDDCTLCGGSGCEACCEGASDTCLTCQDAGTCKDLDWQLRQAVEADNERED